MACEYVVRCCVTCLHRRRPPEYACWTLASRSVGLQC